MAPRRFFEISHRIEEKPQGKRAKEAFGVGDGAEWVFVEVRARGQARYGGAAASVGWRKQQRVARAAQLYLLRRFGQSPWPACRFDVVAFEADEPHWIRAAFAPG